MQFKRAIDDIECTTLSPNMAEINMHIKKTKEKLDLRQDDSKILHQTAGSPRRLKLVVAGNSQDRFLD